MYSSPIAWVAGTVKNLYAEQLNVIKDACDYLAGYPTMFAGMRPLFLAAMASSDYASSVPANTWVTVRGYDDEVIDNDDGYDIASTTVPTSEYVAATAGWYLVRGSVYWETGVTNATRTVALGSNGSPDNLCRTDHCGASSAGLMGTSGMAYLNVGDYLTMNVRSTGTETIGQVVGSGLALTQMTSLSLIWVSS
jgi:hypothetical protein